MNKLLTAITVTIGVISMTMTTTFASEYDVENMTPDEMKEAITTLESEKAELEDQVKDLKVQLFDFQQGSEESPETAVETEAPEEMEATENENTVGVEKTEVTERLFSDVETVSDGKLIVGTEAGFAPYEYLVGSEVKGIDMDIAQAIADALGVELEVQNMDFDGALLAVQQGKVDIVAAGVSVSDEREEVMDFSVKYVDSKDVILVNKADPKVEESTAEALEGKVVGVQQGNIADLWVSENAAPKSVQRYTDLVQAVQDLFNGEIDCIVVEEDLAIEQTSAIDSLKILEGDVLFEDSYAIAIKKDNDDMTAAVNAVITELQESGEIDEIIASHSDIDTWYEEKTSVPSSISDTASNFTNKYGTSTTKCAKAGCNNYIASSGDTAYCTTHSNRCLECHKYIDGDAMYCMDCLTKAASSSSSGKTSSYGDSSYSSSSNDLSGYGYDPSDPYYSAADHDGDGKLTDDEFQEAMGNAIDDLAALYGG